MHRQLGTSHVSIASIVVWHIYMVITMVSFHCSGPWIVSEGSEGTVADWRCS